MENIIELDTSKLAEEYPMKVYVYKNTIIDNTTKTQCICSFYTNEIDVDSLNETIKHYNRTIAHPNKEHWYTEQKVDIKIDVLFEYMKNKLLKKAKQQGMKSPKVSVYKTVLIGDTVHTICVSVYDINEINIDSLQKAIDDYNFLIGKNKNERWHIEIREHVKINDLMEQIKVKI